MNMHEDQVSIDAAHVRLLLADQFPQLATEAVTPIRPGGTVTAVFRIGERLAARFPLQGAGPREVWLRLDAERRAASRLIGLTRFATPVPVGLGEPDEHYPFPWALQSWVPGETADAADAGSSTQLAADLAEFIGALRSLDTAGQHFSGSGRGGVLANQDDWVQRCLRELEPMMDIGPVRRAWASMRDLPRGEDPDVLCHQDLMPGNLVMAGGGLRGVIDVGDLGPADPALDLTCAWHVLGAYARPVLFRDLGCTPEQWARGRAWALAQAVGLPWYYERSHPAMARTGVRTIERVLADLEDA